MSSQGKIQYALEKLESAYAPFKDKNGQYQYHQSSIDSIMNNDCQFKTICFKKTLDSTIQQENLLFCNIEVSLICFHFEIIFLIFGALPEQFKY